MPIFKIARREESYLSAPRKPYIPRIHTFLTRRAKGKTAPRPPVAAQPPSTTAIEGSERVRSPQTVLASCRHDSRHTYVFCQENGAPYEPRTYQDLFKRCVRRAGIQETNFHALRHTFATRALEHGMDVVTLSRILGHANPSITLDKYGHAQEEQKKRSINQMGDIYQHTTEQRLAAQEAEIAAPKLSWGW